nr:hypothetical protein [Marinicella sp. W31]MDC2878999.1 hypothetical protein [Marinicella sp. W31]
METKLALMIVGLALAAPNAFAGQSLLDQTNRLCFGAFEGALLESHGFEAFQMETKVPFMISAYQGEIDGNETLVFLGERFGRKICDVNLPDATVEAYDEVHASLSNLFGIAGTNYDQPGSENGYRGEIWADTETMSGPIENLEIEGMDLSTVFVQFTRTPFRQTADRSGFIISYSTR